jgi:hypothetical protein
MPGGSSQVLTVRPSDGPTLFDTFDNSRVLDEAARYRQIVLAQLFRDASPLLNERPLVLVPRGFRQGTGSHTLVAGWVGDPPYSVSLEPDDGHGPSSPFTRRSLGLIVKEPDVTVVDETFLVPKGSMVLDLPEQPSRRIYYGKSAFQSNQPETGSGFTLRYALPDWAREAQVQSAFLFVHFESEAFELRVAVDDQAIPLPEGRAGKVEVPQARDRFQQGAIDLRLEVVPRRDLTSAKQWQGSPWFLREIEVECLCVRAQRPSTRSGRASAFQQGTLP